MDLSSKAGDSNIRKGYFRRPSTVARVPGFWINRLLYWTNPESNNKTLGAMGVPGSAAP